MIRPVMHLKSACGALRLMILRSGYVNGVSDKCQCGLRAGDVQRLAGDPIKVKCFITLEVPGANACLM